MKLTRLLTIGAFAAAAACAQSSGTITIGGSIPGGISITSDTNGSLSPTMTLGALVAGNSSALAMLNLPVNVRLRSNQQFKLNAAAVFTQNRVQAAPVKLSRRHLKLSGGLAGAILVNAGNANCATRTGDAVDIGVSVEQDLRHLRVPPSPLAPPLVALLHDFVSAGASARYCAKGSMRSTSRSTPS